MPDLSLFFRVWREQYERCRRLQDDPLCAAVTATLVALSTARALE